MIGVSGCNEIIFNPVVRPRAPVHYNIRVDVLNVDLLSHVYRNTIRSG